jgi:hypothetical protein
VGSGLRGGGWTSSQWWCSAQHEHQLPAHTQVPRWANPVICYVNESHVRVPPRRTSGCSRRQAPAGGGTSVLSALCTAASSVAYSPNCPRTPDIPVSTRSSRGCAPQTSPSCARSHGACPHTPDVPVMCLPMAAWPLRGRARASSAMKNPVPTHWRQSVRARGGPARRASWSRRGMRRAGVQQGPAATETSGGRTHRAGHAVEAGRRQGQERHSPCPANLDPHHASKSGKFVAVLYRHW